jgi:hypothetical protein
MGSGSPEGAAPQTFWKGDKNKMAVKTRDPNANMVVARDTFVVNVGGRPIEYGKITVRHNKTGVLETIDNHNDIVDEGDEGVPYAFKAFQRVSKNHPAVKACPGGFMPASDVDETVQETMSVGDSS